MSKEIIINKVVDEVIDTLVDNMEELTTHYMYEVGGYTESNSEFVVDHEKICDQVITELYNRIKK
jgi:hypothetical protein